MRSHILSGQTLRKIKKYVIKNPPQKIVQHQNMKYKMEEP
jgi:hypothetical protein